MVLPVLMILPHLHARQQSGVSSFITARFNLYNAIQMREKSYAETFKY